MNPKYPVYIISKGRHESRLTSKALEELKVPYFIAVEPQEYDAYASVIDEKKILVTPFSNLGQGSIPVRNFVWEHSLELGAARHWVLDDNIRSFYRTNRNLKIRVASGTIFYAAEQFVDRYENIALAGFNYEFFAIAKNKMPPYYRNTRIYSCILIQNDLTLRWRGRYNEDTDLSLRVLKSGMCTVLFNAFLIKKMPTMRMSGGNTDELYKGNGRLLMAESLVEQHPDVVTITTKYNRPQHQVDYSSFQVNKLKRRAGIVVPERINNFGMVITQIDDSDEDTESTEQFDEDVW